MSAFRPVLEWNHKLASLGVPWAFAGGWAFDIWLGRSLQPRQEVCIAIERQSQMALREKLSDHDCRIAAAGSYYAWESADWISLPVTEFFLSDPTPSENHLHVQLLDIHDGRWKHHRSHAISLPVDDVFGTGEAGLPIVMPQVNLLLEWTRTEKRTLDIDFAGVVSRLPNAGRDWLRENLARLSHDPARQAG